MIQTKTALVPLKDRPLQSGDHWRCSITHANFRTAALLQYHKPNQNSPTLSYDSLATSPHQLNLSELNPSTTLSPPRVPKDQYHHFIPRFILKRFSMRLGHELLSGQVQKAYSHQGESKNTTRNREHGE